MKKIKTNIKHINADGIKCFSCLYYFIFFLITPLFLEAQTDTLQVDSLKTSLIFDYSKARVEYFTGGDINNFRKVDTTLNSFQKFNPVRDQLFDYAYLGNLGSPYYSRWFDMDRSIGFDYGRHERDLYIFDIEELKYFRSNVPFTDVSYVAGSNAEQLFKITHTRNIGKDVSVSLDFEKIASDGYYQHMRNEYTNVALTGWYKTPGERYAVYAGGIYGQSKNDENGGINNDTLFDYPTPNLAAPFRNEAITSWKNWQGQIMQQYLIGKKITYVVNDSVNAQYFSPALALTHTIGVHNYYYLFEDAEFERSFYGNIFSDPDTLRDQSDVDGFYNKFSIGNVNYKTITKDSTIQSQFNWQAYGLQQYHELSDQSGEYIYHNLIAGAALGGRYLLDSLLSFKLQAETDIRSRDYDASALIRFPGIPLQPAFDFTNALYSPTVIQEHYYGFNNRWDTNLKKIKYTKFGISFTSKSYGFKLMGTYEILKDYIGFDQFEGPLNANLSVKKIMVNKNFNLGNFHLNNYIGIQRKKSTFLITPFDMPEFLANISWYYENHLFKSALFFQTGFDVWYCSDYNLHGYEFVTGNWLSYGSEDDPTQQNFMPVIDVFANFDIRTFRFFVKMDNVAQGLFNKGYYEAPHYPMQQRGFKLGVDWFLFY